MIFEFVLHLRNKNILGADIDKGFVFTWTTTIPILYWGLQQVDNWSAIRTLFDVEMKVLPWDAIEAPQMPLRLVPEILNSIDMIGLVGKQLWMVDTHVMELGNI